MPVLNVHCSSCGTEFVDSRRELAEGDEAICPKCGSRNEFTRAFADEVERGIVETNIEAPVAHSELQTRKPVVT